MKADAYREHLLDVAPAALSRIEELEELLQLAGDRADSAEAALAKAQALALQNGLKAEKERQRIARAIIEFEELGDDTPAFDDRWGDTAKAMARCLRG